MPGEMVSRLAALQAQQASDPNKRRLQLQKELDLALKTLERRQKWWESNEGAIKRLDPEVERAWTDSLNAAVADTARIGQALRDLETSTEYGQAPTPSPYGGGAAAMPETTGVGGAPTATELPFWKQLVNLFLPTKWEIGR